MIRTFLKEAHKSVVVHSSASNAAGAPTASLRAAALGELAAKVVDLLDISIEELETEVPPKYQRLLMDSLSATTNVPNGEFVRFLQLLISTLLKHVFVATKDRDC